MCECLVCSEGLAVEGSASLRCHTSLQVQLLKDNGVGLLVDVRTVPRSRTNPQFNKDVSLAAAQPPQPQALAPLLAASWGLPPHRSASPLHRPVHTSAMPRPAPPHSAPGLGE